MSIREELSLYASLSYHLHGNHYPSFPLDLIQACIDAIDAGNEGDFEREIDMPESITYKGKDTATAGEIIETCHLHFYLNDEDGEY